MTKVTKAMVRYATPQYPAQRDVSASITLPAGKYVVIPSTFKAGGLGKYWLSVSATCLGVRASHTQHTHVPLTLIACVPCDSLGVVHGRLPGSLFVFGSNQVCPPLGLFSAQFEVFGGTEVKWDAGLHSDAGDSDATLQLGVELTAMDEAARVS